MTHTPIPARPVEPMSRRQSRGTNLPVSDPFTEIRDDGGVNFKLYFRKKGTPSPDAHPSSPPPQHQKFTFTGLTTNPSGGLKKYRARGTQWPVKYHHSTLLPE